MLTRNDIELLKEVFATKADLIAMENRMDKKYATKEDLNKTAGELNIKIENIIKEVHQMVEAVGELVKTNKQTLHELQTHRIIFGQYEERLQRIEKIS